MSPLLRRAFPALCPRFTLKDRVDGKPRYDLLFGLSDASPQPLRATFTRFLEPEADTKAGHGP